MYHTERYNIVLHKVTHYLLIDHLLLGRTRNTSQLIEEHLNLHQLKMHTKSNKTLSSMSFAIHTWCTLYMDSSFSWGVQSSSRLYPAEAVKYSSSGHSYERWYNEVKIGSDEETYKIGYGTATLLQLLLLLQKQLTTTTTRTKTTNTTTTSKKQQILLQL